MVVLHDLSCAACLHDDYAAGEARPCGYARADTDASEP